LSIIDTAYITLEIYFLCVACYGAVCYQLCHVVFAIVISGPSLTLLLPTRPGIRQTASSRKIVNDELSECMF